MGQTALLVSGIPTPISGVSLGEKLPCHLRAKAGTQESSKGPKVTLATDVYVKPDYGCEATKYLVTIIAYGHLDVA